MSISSTVRKAGPFIGTGLVSTFPFSFKVFSAADLSVVRVDANGVESTLVLTTDYTVTLNPNQEASPGGSVTLVAGALATGYTLALTTAIPELQGVVLTNLGGFYPDVINDALDRLTILIQQVQGQADRSLKLAVTDPATNAALWTATARKGFLFGFDSVSGAPVLVPQGSGGPLPGTVALTNINNNFTAAQTFTQIDSKKIGGVIYADQYASIAAAVAALSGAPGTVMVSPGTYTVANTISLAPGQHIKGTAPATSGFGTVSSPIGAILQWTGGTSSPVIHLQNCHGCSVEGLTIDCNNVSGAIGILYDSTGGAVNASSLNEFRNLNFKGFHFGFVVGLASTTADTNGFECDTFLLEDYTMLGNNSDLTNIGVVVNSANGGQQSIIGRGSFQWVNCAIRIVKTNGGLKVENTVVGSPIGSNPAHIQADSGSAGNIYENNETEGAYTYSMHDSSTNSGFGSSAVVLIGNQFFCPVLIDGSLNVLSIGNKGLTGSFTRSGNAFINSIGDQNVWAADASGKIQYAGYLGTEQVGMRLGVGGSAEVVNANKNASVLISGSGNLVGIAQRGVVDANTYTGATNSAMSFESQPITATANTPGYAFAAATPTATGGGTWSSYYSFYSALPAGSGNYFIKNDGGAQSDFGGSTVVGISSLTVGGTAVTKLAKYTATLTPAAVAANTTAVQTFAVTGVAIGDTIVSVAKPTAQAGLGIVGWYNNGTNSIGIVFSNVTGAPITPTASELYAITVIK